MERGEEERDKVYEMSGGKMKLKREKEQLEKEYEYGVGEILKFNNWTRVTVQEIAKKFDVDLGRGFNDYFDRENYKFFEV